MLYSAKKHTVKTAIFRSLNYSSQCAVEVLLMRQKRGVPTGSYQRHTTQMTKIANFVQKYVTQNYGRHWQLIYLIFEFDSILVSVTSFLLSSYSNKILLGTSRGKTQKIHAKSVQTFCKILLIFEIHPGISQFPLVRFPLTRILDFVRTSGGIPC